ncbi:MAG: oligopeptide:H+ symporter, partial [Lactobacillaceae bacterium]|nr:oligopeptide:H+ symporter [Lactobacillaceae bacterium]
MDTKTQKNGLLNIAKGFPTILSTEFAERFSYYGMKAILVMYIFHSIAEGGLGLSKADAAAIASVYGAMIYMTSILGGWVSDRILGTARTVLIGSLFILAGHITLSLPFGLNALLVSLVLLIIGTGLLKPNVATMVGAVITDDSKRSTGFSLLYLSVNIGSFISPIVVGFLRNKYGFHAGFSAAAIVMLIGIITFAYGYKKYFKKMSNKAPNPIDNSEKKNI